ncbi:hypothetical protein PSM7751_01994 [Pseudooceanicola marinus]|uniref:Uncharacterized protein n=1 Tax=Pseudooceanicola marinus TaxID=396013 RepID=A0A1X6Z7Y5_9RHOB|nr:hypothetical protein [Pseudooceanicola marinus]PJE28086.1 hypothetical protein CVM50_14050 [Pseudooceanicola marinus]SLN43897.1 hypothetical protein PSM7751_01994 [Pseudooceanicola marinus]
MTDLHTPDELAKAKAHAESRAAEATKPALRIFLQACADVLAEALKSEKGALIPAEIDRLDRADK